MIARKEDLAEIVCDKCRILNVCASQIGKNKCAAFEKLWSVLQIQKVKPVKLEAKQCNGCQTCAKWFPNVPKEPETICCKGSYDNNPCEKYTPKEE